MGIQADRQLRPKHHIGRVVWLFTWGKLNRAVISAIRADTPTDYDGDVFYMHFEYQVMGFPELDAGNYGMYFTDETTWYPEQHIYLSRGEALQTLSDQIKMKL